MAELAWAFQDSVVDVLATRTVRAASAAAPGPWSWAVVWLPTECCAIDRGRAALVGRPLVVPRPGLCTDNGAMIGAAGIPPFPGG